MTNDRYQYTESGLDNIYLVSGFKFVESPRGASVAIDDVEGLHLLIGGILVREKKKLNGKEFRFLRHELNMTQEVLASLLRVDAQAVARWEKGKSEVPGPAQGLVRLIYEQKRDGNQDIIQCLEALAELDEELNDRAEELEFQDTPQGWQLSKAA